MSNNYLLFRHISSQCSTYVLFPVTIMETGNKAISLNRLMPLGNLTTLLLQIELHNKSMYFYIMKQYAWIN